MKVSRDGRVTIPKKMRDALGLSAGSEVSAEILADGSGFVVRTATAIQTSGQALAERLRGRGDVEMSTDEIMALTRGG